MMLMAAAPPEPDAASSLDPGLLIRQGDGSYAPGALDDLPIAVRNQPCLRYNNYWCLKGEGWEGKAGIGEQHLAMFTQPAWAARAFALTMRTYQFKHKLETPRAVMSRYILSPACVNGGRQAAGCARGWSLVDRYAARIGTALGIGPDERIGLFKSRDVIDTDKARKMFREVAHIEIGIGVQVTEALIDEGLRRAGIEAR